MSTFRSANSSRQSQSQIFTPIQKRQTYTPQQQIRPPIRQPIRKGSSIASSVYDTEEFQPSSRLTLKQAITLITLRLGKLEVFSNDMKLLGSVPRSDGEVVGLDKEFLMSIVSRLDNMEKMQHNLRVEIENIKNSTIDINNFLSDEPEVVIDLNEQPIILDILNRLNALDTKEPEIVEILENTVSELNYPVYNPDVIESYVTETISQPEIQDITDTQVSQTALQPPQFSSQPPQFSSQPPQFSSPEPQITQVSQTLEKIEQNPKTPRRKGKKITII